MKSSSYSAARRRAGFTLIELLTVIAIIGILAAIIIPTVSGVKEKARAIQCGNRIRSWGMAVTMFAADNKGRYAIKQNGDLWCEVSNDGAGGSGGIYIPYFARGQTKRYEELQVCPSGQGESEYAIATTLGNTPGYSAYALAWPWLASKNNATIPETGTGNSGAVLIPLNSARQPSKTLLVMERAYAPGGTAYNTGDYATIEQNGPQITTAYTTFSRHNKRAHAVFMDGHVKTMQWTTDMLAGSGRGASFNKELLRLD